MTSERLFNSFIPLQKTYTHQKQISGFAPAVAPTVAGTCGDRPSNRTNNRGHVSIKNKLRLLQWPLRARNNFLAKIGMLHLRPIKRHKSSREQSKCICHTKFSILFLFAVIFFQDNWIIIPGDGSPSATSFVIVLLVVIRFSIP